jgi:hypothetical protein
MRCGHARRLLWLENGPRAVTPEIAAAQTHLAECEACQQFLGDMRHLGEHLRLLAPRLHAPVAVRERVFTALARARVTVLALPPAARRVPWWMTAAVLLLACGVGLLWVTRSRHHGSASVGHNALSAVAEDHIRSLSDQRIMASETETVARWLGKHVPFAIHVPALPNAQLEGGRLCFLQGQQGVVLWYRVEDKLVSYYIMPRTPHEHAVPALRAFHQGAEAGYRVVAWRQDGLLHALVGALPYARLLDLARVCAPRTADAAHTTEADFILLMDTQGTHTP